MADRADAMSAPPDRSGAGLGGPNVALFLSLFLLLLAFFIVLTALSQQEDAKAQAVMRSLERTFSSAAVIRSETGPLEGVYTGSRGSVLGETRSFIDEAGAILESEIPAVRIERPLPGRLMQARVRTAALFADDGATLRRSRDALIDRLVAALAAAPPGVAFEVEFLIGTDYDSTNNPPSGQTLSMARAGAFARAMIARGAPPASLAVGLEPGDTDWVRLVFRVVEAPRRGQGEPRTGEGDAAR